MTEACGGISFNPMKKTVFWPSLLLVVVLSLMPVDYLPAQVFSIWDKTQHALGFALLTWFGLQAYPNRRWRVMTGLLLIGAGIEVAQAATGWRYGEWLDLQADGVGILASAGLWLLWARRSSAATAQ